MLGVALGVTVFLLISNNAEDRNESHGEMRLVTQSSGGATDDIANQKECEEGEVL